MYCDNQVPAGIIADKKGCNTMVSFTESGKTPVDIDGGSKNSC